MSTSFEPGSAPRGFTPLCVPSIEGNAWNYVKDCLDTNWVSSVGPYVDRFERMVADYVGADHAVATVNGTAALHTALLVAGVQPDDEVLVSTLTFIASANAIRYVGAVPVFIDAEPHYWQMDPQQVADFLKHQCIRKNGELYNRHTGRRVRGIVPVHALGHPVDMQPLLELAQRYELVMIEDAAEALGARYRGVPVGRLGGDVTCFSFNGNKLITTGGGGMLVTNNAKLAERARHLTTQAKQDPLEYIHDEMGFNYRLTNLQAALGCSQMEVLGQFIEKKRAIAARYDAAFAELSGVTPMRHAEWAFSTCWLYTVRIDAERFGLGSRELLKSLAKAQIQTRPLWQPMHRSPSFSHLQKVHCPVADRLCRDALSLPCSVGLTEAEQDHVIDTMASLARSRTAA